MFFLPKNIVAWNFQTNADIGKAFKPRFNCSFENAIYPEAYDWNPENKSHVGLSEFVIGANKKIVVKGIYKTDDYLKNLDIAE